MGAMIVCLVFWIDDACHSTAPPPARLGGIKSLLEGSGVGTVPETTAYRPGFKPSSRKCHIASLAKPQQSHLAGPDFVPKWMVKLDHYNC